MAHSSELRWSGAQAAVSQGALATLQTLGASEEVYLDLLEAYTFAGGTDQLFADQLFAAAPATVEQVAQVTDLKAAIVALHELYGAMTNVITPTEDRAALLRRMS